MTFWLFVETVAGDSVLLRVLECLFGTQMHGGVLCIQVDSVRLSYGLFRTNIFTRCEPVVWCACGMTLLLLL